MTRAPSLRPAAPSPSPAAVTAAAERRRPSYLRYGGGRGAPRYLHNTRRAQHSTLRVRRLYYELHGSGPVKLLFITPLAATHT
eukprot:gene44799-16338_t